MPTPDTFPATVSYDGLVLQGETSALPTCKLTSTPAYDESGRPLPWVRHTLVVSAVVKATDEASAATMMSDLRHKLSAPNKTLVLERWGLGPLPAAGEQVWDVAPTSLELEPLGGGRAWRLIWTCDFATGVVRPYPTASTLLPAPANASVKYNGVVLSSGPSATFAYALHGVAGYDPSGRTVEAIRYELTLSTVLQGNTESEAEAQAQAWRKQLMRPGGKLELLGLGLGDLVVDATGNRPDVAWGVKPLELELTPIASMLAWQAVWKCAFTIVEPTSGSSPIDPTPGANGPLWLSLSFTSAFEIDDGGFTRRRIRGAIKLPQVRLASDPTAAIVGVAAIRHRLNVPVPLGFRRTSSQWNESADRSELAFEIVDDELRDGPLPAGIAAADLQYEVAHQPQGVALATARLSGWMETAADQSPALALDRLLAIAQDRLTKLQTAGTAAIPKSFSVTRQVFGRRVALAAEFHVARSIANLLATSGMWSAVPQADETQWRTSMESLWRSGGGAHLKSLDADSAVIDILDRPVNQATIGHALGPTNNWKAPPDGTPTLPSLTPTVTAPQSWLEYHVHLRLLREENVSLHRLSKPVAIQPQADGFGPPFTVGPGASVVRELHGPPFEQVVLHGEAIRAGFRPIAPRLVSIAGLPVFERRRDEDLQPISSWGSIPIYRLRWTIVYDFAGYVAAFSPPSSDPLQPLDTL